MQWLRVYSCKERMRWSVSRREARSETVRGTPIPTENGIATPVNPLDMLPGPIEPVIISHNVLPDGRVGVLLENDLTGYGLEEYFILVNSDRGWLVDESIYVTSRVRPSTESAATTFVITAIDLQFEPSRIEITAGEYVTLLVCNEGKARKTFVIPELDIHEELPPGEEISILFKAPKGVYEFYSDVPGQQAAGMKGIIIVLPAN